MRTTLLDLLKKRSRPLAKGEAALTEAEADAMLPLLSGWHRTGMEIHKTFSFPDFHHTMAFVNAVAFVAHQEDHHPDLDVSYNRVRVRFSTHSVGGLSENDFICAAKVETLLRPPWTEHGG
ncbi:MAG: 4a-hydroxytetrahydrobiopterin dehydratase [Tepidisphaerales bacterium]